MLRSTVLALALCALVIAIGALFFSMAAWPFVFWTAIIVVALAIERKLYGEARAERPGAGWQATGERFFDDASGHQVEVWFEPATGKRRYVKID